MANRTTATAARERDGVKGVITRAACERIWIHKMGHECHMSNDLMPYLTGVGRFLPLVLARPPAFGEWRLAAMPTRLYPIAESSTRSVRRPRSFRRVREKRGADADGRTDKEAEGERGREKRGGKKCHECEQNGVHFLGLLPEVILVAGLA